MPRKFCAISFCTALLAFAALFTSTSAVAQEDCLPPNSFTTPSGWAVTLTEGPVKEGYLYRYTYTVNKSDNGKKYNGGQAPSHFNLAIPNCCPDPINLVGVDHYYESGEGDPTSKWLSGYFQARVAKYTSHPTDGVYSFLASTSTIGETSVCLKVKNKLECGAIAGPVCQEDASSPTLVEIMGPDKFIFVKSNPALKCYDLVYGCDKEDSNEVCLATSPITGRDVRDITYEGVPITIVTSEQKCVTYIQFGEGSTRCPTIGGKTYCR